VITLLGSLLGFSTSIIPEILGFFKQGQANKQELAMLEAKAQYAQALSSMQLEELDAKAEIVETEKLYEHDMALAARGGWVVSLQASVRPVITYLFMATFIAVEGGLVYSLMTTQGADWVTALQAAWSENSQALFSAILSFWFGGRAMSKARAVIAKR
tara:strand:+ start:1027 stop:1500 length:474 start_codon:yes stop_codon:yes gene_type:complete